MFNRTRKRNEIVTVDIYDTTLRDGAQAEGISYSLQDKINIARALDRLGVSYIEAGNPGSNPKDIELFKYLKANPLKNSKVMAFGSTCKKNIKPEEDPAIMVLLDSCIDGVTIFGKTWDMQVKEVLKTDEEENLRMIRDTVRFFKDRDIKVFFDAEHFFDGFEGNPEYAESTIEEAVNAGADMICLCDTNGGTLPYEIYEMIEYMIKMFPGVSFGIHAHDDCGMALANSLLAVDAGAVQVQGTITGFGERCGNANLSALISNLVLKRDTRCINEDELKHLTSIVREIAEISNIKLNTGMPYVGKNAFTHKAGMHVDGMLKKEGTYEHISPETVGNVRRIVMSEAAGRSLILEKIKKFIPDIYEKDSQEALIILNRIKELEHEGYSFEGAEASFELLVMKLLGKYSSEFVLEKLNIISEQTLFEGHKAASAIVKVRVGENYEITAAEGDGPVNALDKALRKALKAFFKEIGQIRLTDYKVRVLDSSAATGAKVRVLIESTDGKDYWSTVGVSNDVIKASSKALMDSLEYKLMMIKRRI